MPTRNGVDVAKYQYYIDHPLVFGAEIGWWAHKLTLGTSSRDPYATRNFLEADKQPFRIKLFYHWLTPTSSVDSQVSWFIQNLPGGRLPATWGVMLDAEQDGITEEMAYQWCVKVEAITGLPVAVYTGLYVAGGTIWHSNRIFDGRRARILAAYVSESRLQVLIQRDGGGIQPDAWQFLGAEGRCPGVARKTLTGPLESLACDNDQVNNWAIFELACGLVDEPPTTTKETKMTIVTMASDTTDNAVWVTDLVTKRWVQQTAEASKLLKLTGQTAPDRSFTTIELDRIPTTGKVPPGWTDYEKAARDAVIAGVTPLFNGVPTAEENALAVKANPPTMAAPPAPLYDLDLNAGVAIPRPS